MENTQHTVSNPNMLQYCKYVGDRHTNRANVAWNQLQQDIQVAANQLFDQGRSWHANGLTQNPLTEPIRGVNSTLTLRIATNRIDVCRHGRIALNAETISQRIRAGNSLPNEANRIEFSGLAEKQPPLSSHYPVRR